MPQMSTAQARVIDPILSTAARGYQNNAFIGMRLFPYVGVKQRGGKVITFGKEDFLLYNTARAPGTATKRVQFGHAGDPYSLEQHALEGVVPNEFQEEAEAVPAINLGAGAVRKTQNIIGLRLEYAQAVLATTAANYPSGNKITLSGTSQWSDHTTGVSDPLGDFEAGRDAVRAKVGKRPNVAGIGPAVFSKLRNHPRVLDRFKYTGRDSVTAKMLSELLEIEILVGDAIYDPGNGVFVDVWGKFVAMAFSEVGDIADQGLPTYGYTYRLDGYPVVEEPYADRNAKSWAYPVTDEVSPVIAGATAGYLISGAVA